MGADALHILSIIGTRPEAIKMLPVFGEISRRSGMRQTVMLTGQHPDLAIDEGVVPGSSVQRLSFDPRHQTAGEIHKAIEFALRAPLLHACAARMATPSTAFGDGHASERIADLIETYFRDRQTTAPRNSP